jgi:hypothetical protein
MTLHLTQIFFTDARTFMAVSFSAHQTGARDAFQLSATSS